MNRLAFTVPGEPRGKGRPRATTRGGFVRMFTDAKTASYENMVGLTAREALGADAPFDEPLAVFIRIRLCPAASASKKAKAAMLAGETPPTKKPDMDNVVKAIVDGCNAIVFRDDVLIVEQHVTKIYADTPGVDVVIRPFIREAA